MGLHTNGLGVVRALGRQHVPVIAIDRVERSEYTATNYARYVRCPDLRGEGLIDVLVSLGRELATASVLIPTLDQSVVLISRHRRLLEPRFRHSLPDDRVVQQLLSKASIESFAALHGFRRPRTFILDSENDLDACAPELTFPCILKPQLKSDEFMEHRQRKAYRLETTDELRRVYTALARHEPRMIVQEYIPGPDTQLIFCLYYFDEAGVPLISFTGRKIRQFIPHCGTACSAEPWDDEWVKQAGIRFFQASGGYRGFGAIEFKQDREGHYYLIEPTVGRTEHLFALAEANGVPITWAGYCHMAGLPLPEVKQTPVPVKYVDWRRDWRATRVYMSAGELSPAQWLRSLHGRRTYAIAAWDDFGPLATRFMDRFKRHPRALMKGISRVATRVRTRLERSPTGRVAAPGRSPHPPAIHRDAALDWLCAAQDATGSGGVSRAYLVAPRGQPRWLSAYPETTGYIIPTFLECAHLLARPDLRRRAIEMAEWETLIQRVDGGIQGGVIGAGYPSVVFNTGQVVLGWCAAFEETRSDRFLDAATRAADFLVRVQDEDGAWRRYAKMDEERCFNAYDVRVAWALLRVYQLSGAGRFYDAAIRNLEFTIPLQAANGWVSYNNLRPARNDRPLTHTIAYFVEGITECATLTGDSSLGAAARRTADAMLAQLQPDGFLAGEYYADWRPAAGWCCLTGSAQFAAIWLRLHANTSEHRYLDAATRALDFLCGLHDVAHSDPGCRGGVSGSHPIDAPYASWQYVNWAAKFFVDALVLWESATKPPQKSFVGSYSSATSV